MNYYDLATTASSAVTCSTVLSSSGETFTVASPYYDNSMAKEEKDNKKTIAYNVAGIKVKGEKVFENKTKTTKLHFYGESNILGKNIRFDETLTIDTDVYNKYDWYVNNGILYVVLYEKINKEPEFNRVEKPKKATKEEVTE